MCNDRFRNECPIVCGNPRCQDEEHTAVPAQLELCQDSPHANCDTMKQLCKHDTYGIQVRAECPASCGICKSPPVEVCEDMSDDCETVLEYCTDETTHTMMRLQCAKTCGLCGKPITTTTTTTTTTVPTTIASQEPCELKQNKSSMALIRKIF